MAYKVGMVSLGCAKNQVDGEVLMASLQQAGFLPVEDLEEADIAIVNTCGFIDSAKRESIEAILDLAALKGEGRLKKLVVTGCLGERYQKEMHSELPEVDAVIGIGANGEIGELLTRMLEEDRYVESFPEKGKMPLCGERVLTTPSYFAYVKIAEGCDNRCSYCAIPLIRGGYRSRTMESIEEECRSLVAKGAKEIDLIAQDTSRYGIDLYGAYSLAKLMERLCRIDGLKWLRVLYCYPDSITDELLEVMAREEKIVKYMDIPLQHASGPILKAMNRRGDRQSLTALMKKIREKVPGVVLRTTLIAGFPGETEEDFCELAQFVKDVQFERMGCFAYSQEEGTPAGEMARPDRRGSEGAPGGDPHGGPDAHHGAPGGGPAGPDPGGAGGGLRPGGAALGGPLLPGRPGRGRQGAVHRGGRADPRLLRARAHPVLSGQRSLGPAGPVIGKGILP